MFLSNKYSLCYYNIVSRAKSRVLEKDTYSERHHIIPKSLGGNNDPSNIVRLTAREHLLCHRLLTKITVGKTRSKMIFALWRMMFGSAKHQRSIPSRLYEQTKISMSNAIREQSKQFRHTSESKKKISLSKLGKSRNVTWGQQISKANTGKKKSPLSAETKEKISNALTGKKTGPMTTEHKQKVADSKRGKKIQVDPVTGRRYYQ